MLKVFYSCFLMIFLCACITPQQKHSVWTHLELGAGNYGADGHTQTSQKKTVLKALRYVSNKPNYVDLLPERDKQEYDPKKQYQVLFWTLDQLVKKQGSNGVFHVNDLYPEYADFAVDKLKDYVTEKGYAHIKVASVPGNYEALDVKQLLKPYGKETYDSVHLKNPEISFFNDGLDGEDVISNGEKRAQTRGLLQRLANFSSSGLYFFSVDYRNYFIPDEEKNEFINKGLFYKSSDEWEPVPYVFPTGESFGRQHSRVFFIEREPLQG